MEITYAVDSYTACGPNFGRVHRTATAILDQKTGKTGKSTKKITGKTVRPSAQMKTSTDVNQGNKQNVCEAFCLNIHLASYVKFTVYILTL